MHVEDKKKSGISGLGEWEDKSKDLAGLGGETQ